MAVVQYTVPAIDAATLAFLDGEPRRFGTLATVNPDGTPLQAVIWYAPRADGSILINSRVGRQWPSNLLRDARCSLAVEEGMAWVAIRGEVTVMDDPELAYQDIAALAERYEGHDVAAMPARLAAFRRDTRISFHLVPRSVTVHL